jgi:hypothetical protein
MNCILVLVTPAKAGVQASRTSLTLGPRFRGEDEKLGDST